jgi:hypothetical protein
MVRQLDSRAIVESFSRCLCYSIFGARLKRCLKSITGLEHRLDMVYGVHSINLRSIFGYGSSVGVSLRVMGYREGKWIRWPNKTYEFT